ncbi:MAG: TonB-dependent receptor [Gemmatimonadetes bacterium]|nr:TonB-dependent receptor [Gemmatimonadota bacterium]NNK62476.1 TonB-dependent receptor [Gemmatimonadota bacterium]
MHKTVRLVLLLLAGMLPAAIPVQAQVGQVTGVVRDAANAAPLQGAQVYIEGTELGSLTNSEGRFLISQVPVGSQVLMVQLIGRATVSRDITVTAGQTTTVEITLEQTALALDELVVIGYGTQQRRDVTGSVASVSGVEITEAAVTPNLQTVLQGRLAGVNVAESTGEPGAAPQVLIRGRGSISAGTEPLYVIDGVPYNMNTTEGVIDQANPSHGVTRANPLSNINPNDIENVEVLKDAAAAAIYGSRGSNGVILITTKRGEAGMAPQVSYRAYAGVQTAFNRPEMMNAQEHIEFVKLSRNNAYLFARDPLNAASPYYNPQYDPDTNAGRAENGASGTQLIPEAMVNWDGTDTDWLDLVLDPATLQNYDMSVRGGAENFNYFVSGGYVDQGGVIEGSAFQRLALRANLTLNATEKLEVNTDLNVAYADHDRKAANAPYFGRPPGIIYSAMVSSPVAKVYDENGDYLQAGTSSINSLGNGMTTTNHALAVRDYIDDELQTGRIFGSLGANYALRDNLRYNLLVGFSYDTNNRNFYQGTQLQYRGSQTPQPYAQSFSGQQYSWLIENTANYNKSVGVHDFDVLVGYTAEKQFEESKYVIARNFPDDQVKTVNGGEITGGGQTQEEWSLVSVLGRVNYSLKDRYLATVTFRSDRSSRFGWGNQTGYFPSVSLGWQMTQEPFMRGVELFSQLKPRVSYGVTGNFNIPNYGSIGLVGSTPYVLGDQLVPGATQNTLGNEDLTWETTRQLNMGVDYGILGDRIYGTFDYYVSNTEDLLLNVNVPSSTGFASVLTNIGEVKNSGFEAQLTSRNLVGDFQWSTDFSIGSNSNEVIRLGPEGDPLLARGAAGIRHITQVGGEVGAYWGYVQDGVYMSQAEIDNGPIDMEGSPTVGDIRFKDINGDGVIDAQDRTEIGSYNPDYTWGIQNRFSWRALDVGFFFNGVVGREVLNLTRRHMEPEGNFNLYRELVGRYYKSAEEPGDGIHPKPDRQSHGGGTRPSTRQVEDGSYTALKNITLGYNLPQSVAERIWGSPDNVRLFASVTNVAVWTDYWGWNPEVNIQSSGLTPGEDYGAYPLMRAYQFGLEIGF